MSDKQKILRSQLFALEDELFDVVLMLEEHMLPQVELNQLARACAALTQISHRTESSLDDICYMLQRMRASCFGEVLTPESIPVTIHNREGDYDTQSQGIFLLKDDEVWLYLTAWKAAYRLITDKKMQALKTTPLEVIELVKGVKLSVLQAYDAVPMAKLLDADGDIIEDMGYIGSFAN